MKAYADTFLGRLIDFSGLITFFLLWELLPRFGIINGQFIPPLSTVVSQILLMAFDGTLFLHITASLQRTIIGLVAAVGLAVPLGFLLAGVLPALSKQLRPLFRLFAQINAFSLFPIFILFFGIGELSKVAIIFWSTVWPVLFTTIVGVQNLDPLYIKSARSMGADKVTLFNQVILPGAAPVIFSGVRTGASHAFLMLIAAELIGAHAGLGWVIHNAEVNALMPRLFAGMIIIAVLGTLLNYLLLLAEETVVSWKEAVARPE